MTTVTTVLGLAPFVIFAADPTLLYATLSGVFGYALIVLLLVTGVAIPVYLRRTRPSDTNVWKSVVAPVLALTGLAVSLVLATQNFSTLISGSKSLTNGMFALVYGTFVVGVITALVYRRSRPDVYERIGRQ